MKIFIKAEDEEGLRKIVGIGQSIALKIAELLETGECKYYDDLTKDITKVELEMIKIPQIGAKIARPKNMDFCFQ